MLSAYTQTLTCKIIGKNATGDLKLKYTHDKNHTGLKPGDVLGSHTTEAIRLVYDRLLNTPKHNLNSIDFPYHVFKANMLWWVDATIGMESRWDRTKREKGTVYGWGQFTLVSVKTACNRYVGLVDKWNNNAFNRTWVSSDDNDIITVAILEVAREEDVHPEDLLIGIAAVSGVYQLMQKYPAWYNKGLSPAEKLLTWKELIKNDWKQRTLTNKAFEKGTSAFKSWRFWKAFMWGKKGSILEGQFKTGPTPLFRRLGSGLRHILGKLSGILIYAESKSLNTGEPGLDEYIALQVLNRQTKLVPKFIKDILNKLPTNFKEHKIIMDSLSYDQMAAFIIIHAEGPLGSDDNGWIHMTSNDIDILRKGAKGLYEYGHHSKFIHTGPRATPNLAQILINLDVFFECPQPTARSLFLSCRTAHTFLSIADKRARLKEHLKCFFKDIAIKGDPVYVKYLLSYGDTEADLPGVPYIDRAALDKDLDLFIENSVNSLQDDANILSNPKAYLPCPVNLPIIALQLAPNGQVRPLISAKNLTGVPTPVDTMFLGLKPSAKDLNTSPVTIFDLILRIVIHEYNHTSWFLLRDDPIINYQEYLNNEGKGCIPIYLDYIDIREDTYPIEEKCLAIPAYDRITSYLVLPTDQTVLASRDALISAVIPPLSVNSLGAVLYSSTNITWEPAAADYYRDTIMNAFRRKFKSNQSISSPPSISPDKDDTLWSKYALWGYAIDKMIEETIVRVTAEAALGSYSSLNDMFFPEDQAKMWTPKFIKLLNDQIDWSC
jgi:hypothetical protein